MKRLASFVATISLATAVSTTTVNAAPSHSSIALHDRGSANPAERINVTVHLKLPNEGLFAKTVDALYDPASPTFHHWLTDAQLRAFGPAPNEIAAVRAELERNGLTTISLSKDGFSIRAQGTIGQVGRAFHTGIHVFDKNGKTFRANINSAKLGGLAGAYVSAVSGLESHTVRPMFARAINIRTKRPYAAVALSKVEAAGGLSSIITDKILGPEETVTYTTPKAKLPTATYTGVTYQPDPTLVPDYTPKQLESVYGLDAAYKKGLDGTGQTIVLLEAYGYPTIESDANAFFKLAGLPPLTSSNFQVVYPEGKPANPNIGILLGWDGEIALDVQWAHSIAPGAKIIVVASNGQGNEDFEVAMQYIIDNRLGYTVSDSWESDDGDLFAGPAEQEAFERVLVKAAAKGISFQFSTGDSGDGGLGSPIGAGGVPSVAPHATAVGGTSIFNNPGASGTQASGWGTTFAYIDLFGPVDPPTADVFFVFGAGGGESVFWRKPAWQASLPGRGRQTPDISALADPETGVPLVISVDGEKFIEPGVGGTSLASPIFTAFWAIAQQKAGHALGQAAPTVAALKSGIVDVVPFAKPGNLHGSVTDSSGTTDYSTRAIFASANPSKQNVYAALLDESQYDYAIGFAIGLDSSLTVTKGWDNVTGYGTPAGLGFIEAAAAYR